MKEIPNPDYDLIIIGFGTSDFLIFRRLIYEHPTLSESFRNMQEQIVFLKDAIFREKYKSLTQKYCLFF